MEPLDVAARKAVLRQEMKARRALLNESERARASWRATQTLLSWLESRPERVIGVYLAHPFELSLDALIPVLWSQGRVVVAPRVDVGAGQMKFCRFNSFDEVAPSVWNVREPTGTEALAPEIVFVPGLAYDVTGNRLGTGGGWYDRVLGAVPVKVGVCFDSLIVPSVPCEAHDIRVDWVVSDKRLVETAHRLSV